MLYPIEPWAQICIYSISKNTKSKQKHIFFYFCVIPKKNLVPTNKKLDKLFFYTILTSNNLKPKGDNMVRNTKKNNKKRTSFWARVWNIICWPFKKIWAGLCIFWNWIAGINLVALLNLALLISIIVLFSLLIIDLRKGANAGADKVTTTTVKTQVVAEQQKQPVLKPRTITPRKVTTLPVKRNAVNRKPVAAPIQVAKIPQNPVAIKQVAVVENKTILGNTIIDNHDMTKVLVNGTHIKGNLYIQDLRKYTLPCDIVIDGNLILRDVNMLNFCGDFTVRGNIYVNPRSSFGPVPSTARIGGQVIL